MTSTSSGNKQEENSPWNISYLTMVLNNGPMELTLYRSSAHNWAELLSILSSELEEHTVGVC